MSDGLPAAKVSVGCIHARSALTQHHPRCHLNAACLVQSSRPTAQFNVKPAVACQIFEARHASIRAILWLHAGEPFNVYIRCPAHLDKAILKGRRIDQPCKAMSDAIDVVPVLDSKEAAERTLYIAL